MAKSLHKVSIQKVSQTENVAEYHALGSNGKPVFIVRHIRLDAAATQFSVKLVTKDGTYHLHKHPELNYWHQEIHRVKVQVSIHGDKGEIRFWSEKGVTPKEKTYPVKREVTSNSHGVSVKCIGIKNAKRENDPRQSVTMEITLPNGYMDGTTKSPRKPLQIRKYIFRNGKPEHRFVETGKGIVVNDDQLDLDLIKWGMLEGAYNEYSKKEPLFEVPQELPQGLPEMPAVTYSDPNVAFGNMFNK